MTVSSDVAGRPDPLVLDLAEAGRVAGAFDADLGRGLAALGAIDAPCPGGFAITGAACAAFVAQGGAPDGLWTEVAEAIVRLEQRSGLRLGDPLRPLLLAVSCGPSAAQGSVVGIGMNDEVARGLEERGEGGYAATTYRRLLRTYASTVLGVGPGHFDRRSDEHPQAVLRDLSGEDLPQDPVAQMRRAIDALALAWRSEPRATTGWDGRRPRVPSLAVVQLVSGDRDERSGCGVAYSRDPVTGTPVLTGDFLAHATLDDLWNGRRSHGSLSRLEAIAPGAHAELMAQARRLETELADACELEFVVEQGRLWVLRTRPAPRSPHAAFRTVEDLVEDGTIDLDEALCRVEGAQLQALLWPVFRPGTTAVVVARGAAACPGSRIGRLALDAATARRWASRGQRPVLLITEPAQGDLDVIQSCGAVLTTQPVLASPVAERARELGVPCVAALEGVAVLIDARALALPGGIRLDEGSDVSVDGTSGLVCRGRCETRRSEVAGALRGTPAPAGPSDPVVRAVLRLLGHADRVARLEVHANADTPEEARIARRLGARGIGLCRTEHLLLGSRRELVERLLTDEDRVGALASIEAFTRTDFTGILRAMDGLPVVVRLLDPALHQFLPDLADLAVQAALAERDGALDDRTRRRLAAVRRWRGTNPLLGLRGVRILTVLPQIIDAQVRALALATMQLRDEGLDPKPLVLVPLVAEAAELEVAKAHVEGVVREVCRRHGVDLQLPVGVMIEVPRAALTAASLARSAAFFSFGTNDLTQTVWGMSRDDAEATFIEAYRAAGLLPTDPFVRLDETGVGRLIRLATDEARAVRPDLTLGACGNHDDDGASVSFLADVGLDYVSCSVPRLPLIRLQAGRHALLAARDGGRRPIVDRPAKEVG